MAAKSRNNQNGNTVLEIPFGIAIFFLFLLFPTINLVTMGLRSATAYYAVYNAAHNAARSATFSENDKRTGQVSALNAARASALATKGAALAGTNFTDADVTARVIALPLNSDPQQPAKADFVGAVNKPIPTSLGVSPDFIYQIEVSINTRIEPLIALSPDLFGHVPGFTTAYPLRVTTRQFVENPEGWLR